MLLGVEEHGSRHNLSREGSVKLGMVGMFACTEEQ